MRLVTLQPPESQVKLTLWRPSRDRELILAVKLGKWPVAEDEAIIATREKHPAWRGLLVDYPTARRKYQPFPTVPAVVILGVQPDSPARAAGLQVGEWITHVERTIVRTPLEFAEAVKAARGEVRLKLSTGDAPPRTVVIGE
jgi:S1-C subfamily serine protease